MKQSKAEWHATESLFSRYTRNQFPHVWIYCNNEFVFNMIIAVSRKDSPFLFISQFKTSRSLDNLFLRLSLFHDQSRLLGSGSVYIRWQYSYGTFASNSILCSARCSSEWAIAEIVSSPAPRRCRAAAAPLSRSPPDPRDKYLHAFTCE